MYGEEQVAVVCPGDCGLGAGSERGLGHVQGRLKLVALAGDEAQAEEGRLGARVRFEGDAVGLGGGKKMTL
jgi:hypothetical protein